MTRVHGGGWEDKPRDRLSKRCIALFANIARVSVIHYLIINGSLVIASNSIWQKYREVNSCSNSHESLEVPVEYCHAIFFPFVYLFLLLPFVHLSISDLPTFTLRHPNNRRPHPFRRITNQMTITFDQQSIPRRSRQQRRCGWGSTRYGERRREE